MWQLASQGPVTLPVCLYVPVITMCIVPVVIAVMVMMPQIHTARLSAKAKNDENQPLSR